LAITQSELLGPQIFANENWGSGQQGALRMFEVFWGKGVYSRDPEPCQRIASHQYAHKVQYFLAQCPESC